MNGIKMQEEMNNIPLADDDPQVIINDDGDVTEMSQASDPMVHGRSMDSIPSTFTNGSSSPGPNSLDPDISPDEQEEKARLISQVLELQNTLDERLYPHTSVITDLFEVEIIQLQLAGSSFQGLVFLSPVKDHIITTYPRPWIHKDPGSFQYALIDSLNIRSDLSQRVDSVKEENLKLRSENQVLGQYIQNLMSASSVFQSTSPKTKNK